MRPKRACLLTLLCLTACAPALNPLPTLIPTFTPRSTDTPRPTPLIPTPSGSEPVSTPTPLIAPPPSSTPFVPLAPLAFLPAGEFEMGSAPGADPFADKLERPAHRVRLSAFWIETLEVSNARYALCVAEGACTPPQSEASRTRSDYYLGYADYPVVNVTHAQAQQFCAWTGGRLPTEAEWEYAARFNDGRRYPWGNSNPDFALANYGHEDGDTEPIYFHPEGATALGLINMAGNVWEWVADWYSEEYYAASPKQNPTGPAESLERVARGGAFATDAVFIRTTNRYARDPNKGYTNVGFRCVVISPPSGSQLLPTLTPSPTP